MHAAARLDELAAVLELLSVPAALALDPEARQVRVNEAYARLVGVAADDYVPLTHPRAGLPYRFVRDGRPLEPHQVPFAVTLRGLPVEGDRLDIVRDDGTTFHMVCSAKPIYQDGAPIGAFAIMQDVGAEMHAWRLLREITSLTPALIFTAGARGNIEFVNPRWSELVGVSSEAMLGEGWTLFVHPDDLPAVRAAWASHVAGGQPYLAQWRLRRADGTYRWIEVRAEAERDGAGRVVRWYGSAIDIDVQRRAIDALEVLAGGGAASAGETGVEAQLDRLARATLGGIADVAFFDLVDASGRWRRHVVGPPAIPPDALAALTAFQAPALGEPHPIARALTEGRPLLVPQVDDAYVRDHVRPASRQQAWRIVQIRSLVVAPLHVGDDCVGALTLLRTGDCVPFDAADLRVIEEVARRAAFAIDHARLAELAQREADERERQFHTLADSMPQLMWTATPDGSADWFNQRWYEYTGTTIDDVHDGQWSALIHPGDLDGVSDAWQNALTTGHDYEREFRLRGADGSYRWFLTRAVPARDAAGHVTHWYGSSTDVDEARRTARATRAFADAGTALYEAVGLEETLAAVLRMLVPAYADWGYVTLADEHGDLRLAYTHHPDDAKQLKLNALHGRRYMDAEAPHGSAAALRSGTPLLHQPLLPDHGTSLALDVRAVFDTFQCAAVLLLPLRSGTVTRGTLALCMSAASGRLFERLDIPFFSEFAARVAPAIANAELFERERRVAHSFQQAALPRALPNAPGLTFDAIYEAGQSEALIGGDWFDAFSLIDGRVVVSIGDVAGSGLQAAVTMASVRQAIRGVAHVHADPALMLEAADRTLRAESPERFVTAFVGVIDTLGSVLTYRSAGHPPPLVRWPDGTVTALEQHGLPLGLRDRIEGDTPVVPLPEGSVLALYTDGLIEATHDIAEGERRLRDALADEHITNATNVAQALHDAVLLEGSRDDVAILTVTIGRRARPRRWVLDPYDERAARAVRNALLAALRERGCDQSVLHSAETVFAELIGNLARYAPGPAEVFLETDGARPVLHVRDRGPGFEFTAKLPNDLFAESGRGLYLIAALSEDFHVARRPDGGSHARVVLRV